MSNQDDFSRDLELDRGSGATSPRVIAAAFLEHLYQFLKQTQIHDRSNSIFDRCMKSLRGSLTALQGFPDFDPVTVSVRGEQMYVSQVRLRPKARQFRSHRFLIRFFRLRKIAVLRMPPSFQDDDLKAFLWILSDLKPNQPDLAEILAEKLRQRGLETFEVEFMLGGASEGSRGESDLSDVDILSLVLHEKLKEFADVCFENRGTARQFQLKPVGPILNDLVQISEEDLLQVFRSNLMRQEEQVLGFLGADVCLSAIAWGKSLALPPGVLVEMGGAALAHPLVYLVRGEMRLGALNEKEAAALAQSFTELHEVWGLSELQRLSLFEWPVSHGKTGIYEWQGVRCALHFLSRMIRILSVFRYLTHYRPGSDVFLPDEALTQMLQMKEQFDMTLLKLFVNWVGIYPVGSFVLLKSGELGQVFAGGSDPLRFQRPIVSILKGSDGRLLERPRLFDLNEMNEKLGLYRKSILKSVSFEEAGIPKSHLNMPPVSL